MPSSRSGDRRTMCRRSGPSARPATKFEAQKTTGAASGASTNAIKRRRTKSYATRAAASSIPSSGAGSRDSPTNRSAPETTSAVPKMISSRR
jgi:hypothetical protein